MKKRSKTRKEVNRRDVMNMEVNNRNAQASLLSEKVASWGAVLLILVTWMACFALPFIAINLMTAQWGKQPTLISLITKEDLFSFDSIRRTYYEIALIVVFAGGTLSMVLLLLRRVFVGGIALAITDLGLVYCCIRTCINFINYFERQYDITEIFGLGIMVAFVCLTIASFLLIWGGWPSHALRRAKQRKTSDGNGMQMAQQLLRGVKGVGSKILCFHREHNGRQALAFLCVPTLLFVVIPAVSGSHPTILPALLVVVLIGCMLGCLTNLVIFGLTKLLWLWLAVSSAMALLNGWVVFAISTVSLLLSLAMMYAANQKLLTGVAFPKRAMLLSAGTGVILFALCLIIVSVSTRINVAPALLLSLAVIAISTASAYIIERRFTRRKTPAK